MNVEKCAVKLFIVGHKFENNIDVSKAPLDIDFDNSNRIQWDDDYDVSLHDEIVISRGDTREEAVEGFEQIRSIIKDTYPDSDIGEYEIFNSIMKIVVSATDDEIPDIVEHLSQLEGVEESDVKVFDYEHDKDKGEEIKDATHTLVLIGFDKETDEPYEDYIQDHLDKF